MTWTLATADLGRPHRDETTVRFALTARGHCSEYLSSTLRCAIRDAVPGTAYMQHFVDREHARLRLVFDETRRRGALAVIPTATANRHMVVEVLGITTPASCVIVLAPVSSDRRTWEGAIPEPFASRVRPVPSRKEQPA